jgi:hypothetical protein
MQKSFVFRAALISLGESCDERILHCFETKPFPDHNTPPKKDGKGNSIFFENQSSKRIKNSGLK